MKNLKANFSMIALAWRGSKIWVICTMIDIIINPLRNLTIDVLLIGYLYNAIEQGRKFSSLLPLFAVLLLFYTVNLIFEAVFIGKAEPVGEIKIQKYIDGYLCKSAAKVPIECYDNPQFYEKYIFSMENAADIAKKSVNNMASFIAYGLGGLMSIGLIANIEPVMIIFIALSIVFSLLISNYKKKVDLKYNEQITGLRHKEDYVHRVFYMKEYAKELRAFPELVEQNLDFFTKTEEEKYLLTKKSGKRKWIGSILNTLNNRTIMYWIVMLLTIVAISLRGNIEPGNLLIVTVSIATAALLINAIAWTIPEMHNIARYREKFLEFLSNAEENYSEKNFKEKEESPDENSKNISSSIHTATKDGKAIKQIYTEPKKSNTEINQLYTATKDLNTGINQIQFDHVYFTYPGETKEILKDLSFQVSIGNPLVIVGENGAGKSTIFKLLLKFYKPDRGRILINGMDLSEIDTEKYRKMIGCVFQNVNMYALSLEENTVAADEKTDDKKLEESLKKSGLTDLTKDKENLKKELTKEFSSDGMVLSGGNMQRVAIARSFYQDVSMLLFDEMTSALDPETELEIMDTVRELGQKRIMIMISHKLSCVKQAAQILFLKDGAICETGNHLELMKKQGEYYKLFRYQSEKFEKEKKRDALEGEAWL